MRRRGLAPLSHEEELTVDQNYIAADRLLASIEQPAGERTEIVALVAIGRALLAVADALDDLQGRS
jgi:hypothetical protein